jgi:hypothetical protein
MLNAAFPTRAARFRMGGATSDVRAIVDAIARRDQSRIVADGMTAANDLGLTTAVPARVTVLNERTTAADPNGETANRLSNCWATALVLGRAPAMRVVQALYWLRDLLDSDNGQILQRVRAILTAPGHGDSIRDDLRRGLPTLPIWMQSIVR